MFKFIEVNKLIISQTYLTAIWIGCIKDKSIINIGVMSKVYMLGYITFSSAPTSAKKNYIQRF